ncbi:MAG: hypothetical protein QOF73_901 [Thermomicrobiales bacterium]|jgi:hypothetical protein|nr:hypothetical protein [Thermomicrobiales bacterium]
MRDLAGGPNVEETLHLVRGLWTGDLYPAAWKPVAPTLTEVMAAKATTATGGPTEIARMTDETLQEEARRSAEEPEGGRVVLLETS